PTLRQSFDLCEAQITRLRERCWSPLPDQAQTKLDLPRRRCRRGNNSCRPDWSSPGVVQFVVGQWRRKISPVRKIEYLGAKFQPGFLRNRAQVCGALHEIIQFNKSRAGERVSSSVTKQICR